MARQFPVMTGLSLIVMAVALGCANSRRASTAAQAIPEAYSGVALDFKSEMGTETSYFLRKVAANDPTGAYMASQVRLSSGSAPSVTVSWPAGNSGIFIAFQPRPEGLKLALAGSPEPVYEKGRRGVAAHVIAELGKGGDAFLDVESIVAGTMRVIRTERDGHVPQGKFQCAKKVNAQGALIATRSSVDDRARFRLQLQPINGSILTRAKSGAWQALPPAPGKSVEFRLTATTDEIPLTPVPIADLLTPEALRAAPSRGLAQLSYLVYEEGLLAGADNYLTMFGRDNFFFLAIGGDSLLPKAYEIVFASHLDAMRADGNLTHEPGIGEFAAMMNEAAGNGPVRDPISSYEMVDTRFLLALNIVPYFKKAGPARAAAFLAKNARKGGTFKQALLKNFEFVVASAEPFARDPAWNHLVSIEGNRASGNWRDSPDGLAGGRYPFDVNASFVPASLAAIAEFAPKANDPDFTRLGARAAKALGVWQARAWDLFQVRLSRQRVEADGVAYARELGLSRPPNPPLATLSAAEPFRFSAVALDAAGKPSPALNSDPGFLMFFSPHEPAERVQQAAQANLLPFPYGLRTPVGLLISNGAYLPEPLRKRWTFTGYHKLVVWPWQEFLMAKGLARQLERADLAPDARRSLQESELDLWSLLYKTNKLTSFELYSLGASGGKLIAAPYGQGAGFETSAAILQAWSMLGLLVRPPQRVIDRFGAPPHEAARAEKLSSTELDGWPAAASAPSKRVQ